jgi:outer membrane protein assembly factor BamE
MRSRLPLLVLLAALLAGCNLLYKPEVQQGNPLTPEMIAGLKPGLTKRQVRLLLGSPPVSDVFHPDRWEYVYSLGRAGEKVPPPPRLTLYFKNDALIAADGELAPTGLPRPGDAGH